MANDGIKIILTLKQLISGSGLPTGQTKPNLISDPNYIPPSTDLVACPVSYSLSCPVLYATAQAGTIIYEFSLYSSVINNPTLTGVKFLAISQSAVKGVTAYTFPNSPSPSYFSGSVSVPAGTYTSSLAYMSGSITVSSCSYTGSDGIGFVVT